MTKTKRASGAEVEARWEAARKEIGEHNDRLQNDPKYRAKRLGAVKRFMAKLAKETK